MSAPERMPEGRPVWKYVVPVDDQPHTFDLPMGKPVLFAAVQYRLAVSFWVEVNPQEPTTPRTFRVFGTGHVVPWGWAYCGTALDGAFVWHLYEQSRRQVSP